MNVTWVLGFPTGEEKGQYLTMDLGGTNLRVCWITLQGRKAETTVKQFSYKLPEDMKTGSAENLWKYVTESLSDFISSEKLKGLADKPLPLAFTFSYPATQDCIDHGVLQRWTKGFDIDGVEGGDVAAQLRKAIEQKVEQPRSSHAQCLRY